MSNLITVQIDQLAARFDLPQSPELYEVLKSTAFKDANDAQLSALLIVAKQYGLNPWTKEIYAFPDKKNGIIPVVSVDGWARIINGNPAFDGMDFNFSEEMVDMPGAACPAPAWTECVIHRKDRAHPTIIREYLDEVYRAPFQAKGQNGSYEVKGPWQSHPKRFSRHKAMIQCARMAFGFGGIYDQDEADRIVESKANEPKFMGNAEVVEPTAPPAWPDDAFKARMPKWQAAVDGGAPPAEIVKFARTKGALTPEQEAAILALKPYALSTQQAHTFASVAQKLNDARDDDSLNIAADLISGIQDSAQQAELNAIYETRMAEMAA